MILERNEIRLNPIVEARQKVLELLNEMVPEISKLIPDLF
jgi:uncharacterized spore protein YtfJ